MMVSPLQCSFSRDNYTQIIHHIVKGNKIQGISHPNDLSECLLYTCERKQALKAQ